jgi:glycine/D-amino acid oxidase-like deaminating enzyme/nitrite reductase/ring-hydroxylating ferredoxin subunit
MTSLWLDTVPSMPNGTPPVGGASYDTVVAGAGLTGVTTALLLARAGQRVALVEARLPGAVTTGNTTGKLSLLQGTTMSRIRRHQGDERLRAHAEANRAGQAWLMAQATQDMYQARDAYTYATTDQGRQLLEQELEATRVAGIAAGWADDAGLPFPVTGALLLPGQIQLHPMEVLASMLAEYERLGGVLHTWCRLHGVDTGHGVTVTTSRGTLRADRLVLATGTPVIDRGAYFARLRPLRSYVVACRVSEPVPDGMYLSVDSPSRSMRTAQTREGEFFVVGGNGHPTGQSSQAAGQVADLEHWTAQYWPTASFTHSWSAQDYQPVDGLPYVGHIPMTKDRVLVATGYDKWGMTNSVAAALRLAGSLTGDEPAWAEPLETLPPRALSLVDGLRLNAGVASHLTGGWAAATTRSLPQEPPAEGVGVVGRKGSRPAGMSTVDGRTCTVSAVCTHLGGVLTWNDAERSWDCPLHGSRFSHTGRVLEGPAVDDLLELPDRPDSD